MLRIIWIITICLTITSLADRPPLKDDVMKTAYYAYRHKLILTKNGELWLSTYELWNVNFEQIKCRFNLPTLIDIFSDYSNGRYYIYLLTQDLKLIGLDGLKYQSILEHFGRSTLHSYQSYISGREYGSDCDLIDLSEVIDWNPNVDIRSSKTVIAVEGFMK